MGSSVFGRAGRAAAALVAAILVLASCDGATEGEEAAAGRQAAASAPDIVLLYIDDWSPGLSDLWSDPERTPTLARFVEEGTWLARATGSTPRCCPARANTLTGRWSHNNGVTENDMGPYDPQASVSIDLQDIGYHTLYGGKFLNRMPAYTKTREEVEPYAAGWDEFDANWTNHGKFYDYRLWTRDETLRFKDQPQDHSTFVVAERMAEHIRAAPSDKPIFAFVSLFDGHRPWEPMPRFRDHPLCRDAGLWSPPSWNEADVSDKPGFIQELPLLPGDGFDLVTRCEEMMSVDWAAGRVIEALDESGRLDDTLLIFTADNGHLLGEHRLVDKKIPYATPVPLYVLWPQRWGDEPRTIDEPVSNVDLAPTVCDLAGCGLPDADGMSLMPLLDGDVEALDRRFIYEENLHESRAFVGLRTTAAYDPEQRWVYSEYVTGEKELYDLLEDPWQLQNVAGEASHEEVEAELREMLHENVVGPNEVHFIRPDPAEAGGGP